MLVHGASDMDQRCMKNAQFWGQMYFPPNIFTPTAKITPKPNFGEPFKFLMQTYYTESSP